MTSVLFFQVAVAVFTGNMMTISLIKGYQRMKKEGRFEWVTAFYYLSPLAVAMFVFWTIPID